VEANAWSGIDTIFHNHWISTLNECYCFVVLRFCFYHTCAQVQKDIFPPQAAAAYLPAFNAAARATMPFMPQATFGTLAPFVAFDMFMSMALGYSPKTITSIDPAKNVARPGDVQFANDAMETFNHVVYAILMSKLRPYRVTDQQVFSCVCFCCVVA
jgi:hypothetical protein